MYKKRGLFDAISKVSQFLKLNQLTKKDLESVKKIDGIMDEHAEKIANHHYDMIMEIPAIKNILFSIL